MGLLIGGHIGGPGEPAFVVTLSGESISSSGSGNQEARVEVRVNGEMFKFETDAGSAQIDASTDWVIPNEASSSAFDVRYLNRTGNALDTAPAAEDVWVDMSATRLFGYIDTSSSPSTWKSGQIDLQIRKDGGAPLDIGNYQMVANRTS